MSDNETTLDIVAALRQEAEDCPDIERAGIYNRYADRIEAANAREVQHALDHATRHAEAVAAGNCRDCVLRQPDPDWSEICEKCHDGEEPLDCEYFGEPNGCNSPIYGEHPRTQHANMAKMREALDFCVQQMSDAICDKNFGDDVVYLVGCMKTCIDFMKIALAASARNCDMGTDEEQGKRLRRFCLRQKWCDRCPLRQRSITTQADCKLLWAQMPYESEVKA